MTEPAVLVAEAELLRGKAYRDRQPEPARRHAARLLALYQIRHAQQAHPRLPSTSRARTEPALQAPWKLADAEAWLAKIYWELLEYPAQTILHAKAAMFRFEFRQFLTLRSQISFPETYSVSVNPRRSSLT